MAGGHAHGYHIFGLTDFPDFCSIFFPFSSIVFSILFMILIKFSHFRRFPVHVQPRLQTSHHKVTPFWSFVLKRKTLLDHGPKPHGPVLRISQLKTVDFGGLWAGLTGQKLVFSQKPQFL